MKKIDRYTIGDRVFNLLLDMLLAIMRASYLPQEKKKTALEPVSQSLDAVKVLVRLAKDLEIIPEWDYLAFEEKLQSIGGQLGGWMRSLPDPEQKRR